VAGWQIEKGGRVEIPGTYTSATSALVYCWECGGNAQHLQIPHGRGVGEQDTVMSRQPAQLLPRWLIYVVREPSACPICTPAVRASRAVPLLAG
jgi:hypothetical protein